MDISNIIFNFVNKKVLFFYLNGPTALYGHQGMPLLDICSKELNIPSYLLSGDNGLEICNTNIQNKVYSYTTAIIFLCSFWTIYKLTSNINPILQWYFTKRVSDEEKRMINRKRQISAKETAHKKTKIDRIKTITDSYSENDMVITDVTIVSQCLNNIYTVKKIVEEQWCDTVEGKSWLDNN